MSYLNNSELLVLIWEQLTGEERAHLNDIRGWVDWWKQHNKLTREELLTRAFL